MSVFSTIFEEQSQMAAIPEHRCTLDEYLELDKNSEERLEYFDGEVVSMSGGSLSHNLIEINVIAGLHSRSADRKCSVLPADMRLKVPKAPPYRYADVVVVCGNPVIENIQGLDVLVNPTLIVEILSESTEAYDRGNKFLAYQSIESFEEYLLIAQDMPYVTHYLRQLDGQWLRSDIEGLDREINLLTVASRIPLREIYADVEIAASS
jgi:Uma2 family endonuclease